MTRENSKPIKVTLSGSFHKNPHGLAREYRELIQNQCQVLSPRSLDFEDESLLFVRNRVERQDSVNRIESFHLQAIALSDFLWLHAPHGYVGISGAMEIGYAIALGIPVYSTVDLQDQTLNSFITKVPSVFAAIEQMGA